MQEATIATPLQKIYKNLNNLIPYIGALFVTAGIIGLLFLQKPLKTPQELRGAASSGSLYPTQPSLDATLITPFVVNETGEVDFFIDNGEFNVSNASIVFNIVNNYLDTPEVFVNENSGFDAKKIEIEQITDGYLVEITAVRNNLSWFVPPEDQSFVKLKLTPRKSGSLQINFDPDRSFAVTTVGNVLIGVPDSLVYAISGLEADQQKCIDSGGTWREFTNSCADTCKFATNLTGIDCSDVITSSCDCGTNQCWNGESCEDNPTSPPPTSPPPTEPPVQGCNETCNTNGDCEVGMRCYATNGENRCRLAINPSSESCQKNGGDNGSIVRSCNQYCESNAECATGLTCYSNYCRNPKNPQDNRCVDPSDDNANAIILSCGQTCSTNADCAINLRCYQNECRLVTNPSSTSCSAVTNKTISNTYKNKYQNATQSAEIDNTDTPVLADEPVVEPEPILPQEEPSPTWLESLQEFITNAESKLPILVILLGILLLIISISLTILSKAKKSKETTGYRPNEMNQKMSAETHEVKPNNNEEENL